LHHAFVADALDERGEFCEAEGFEDGLAAHVGAKVEKFLKGLIDEQDAAAAVEDEDAFDHAVEQGVLLGLKTREEPLVVLFAGGEFLAKPLRFVAKGGQGFRA
jgi:hypothetical protein